MLAHERTRMPPFTRKKREGKKQAFFWTIQLASQSCQTLQIWHVDLQQPRSWPLPVPVTKRGRRVISVNSREYSAQGENDVSGELQAPRSRPGKPRRRRRKHLHQHKTVMGFCGNVQRDCVFMRISCYTAISDNQELSTRWKCVCSEWRGMLSLSLPAAGKILHSE